MALLIITLPLQPADPLALLDGVQSPDGRTLTHHVSVPLALLPAPERQVDVVAVVPLRQVLPSLKGRFAGRASGPVSVAMMDEAIAAEVLARHVTHPNTQP